MSRYHYVLHENACTAVFALDDQQLAKLLTVFETLASHPTARADSYSLDRQGRPLGNKIAGELLIGYWHDHSSRILHILSIELLPSTQD